MDFSDIVNRIIFDYLYNRRNIFLFELEILKEAADVFHVSLKEYYLDNPSFRRTLYVHSRLM